MQGGEVEEEEEEEEEEGDEGWAGPETTCRSFKLQG